MKEAVSRLVRDKLLLSDIVFLRTWTKVDVQFYRSRPYVQGFKGMASMKLSDNCDTKSMPIPVNPFHLKPIERKNPSSTTQGSQGASTSLTVQVETEIGEGARARRSSSDAPWCATRRRRAARWCNNSTPFTTKRRPNARNNKPDAAPRTPRLSASRTSGETSSRGNAQARLSRRAKRARRRALERRRKVFETKPKNRVASSSHACISSTSTTNLRIPHPFIARVVRTRRPSFFASSLSQPRSPGGRRARRPRRRRLALHGSHRDLIINRAHRSFDLSPHINRERASRRRRTRAPVAAFPRARLGPCERLLHRLDRARDDDAILKRLPARVRRARAPRSSPSRGRRRRRSSSVVDRHRSNVSTARRPPRDRRRARSSTSSSSSSSSSSSPRASRARLRSAAARRRVSGGRCRSSASRRRRRRAFDAWRRAKTSRDRARGDRFARRSARRRLASRHGRFNRRRVSNFVLLDRWIGTLSHVASKSRVAVRRTISVDACAFSPRALVVFARLRASSRLSGDDLRRRRLHDDDLRLRSSPDPVRHGRRRRLSIVHLPTHLALQAAAKERARQARKRRVDAHAIQRLSVHARVVTHRER